MEPIIVDAHQDIAYNYYRHGRNYRTPVLKTRAGEEHTEELLKRRGIATNGLPDAILGRVAVTFATIYVLPAWVKGASPSFSYQNEREAHDWGMKQVDYYNRLVDEEERIHFIKTEHDLDAVLETWGEGKTLADHRLGIVLLMENADPIIEPAQTEEWYERGLRVIGPAWSETRYCGGTGKPGPLTDLGRELLEVMGGLNMLLDLSHMAEKAYFESLDRYQGSIIASHSNPRHFVESDRHLSDEMILRLAERDGVIGVVPFSLFMKKGWSLSDKPDSVRLDDLLAIIDYYCQLTGSARHVGIGSDLDGGFGAESMPLELDTVTDLWRLRDAMKTKLGYGEEDIANILSGNFLRKLREVLP